MILLAFVPFKVYNKSNFRGRLIHRNINKWDFLPPKIGVDLYTSSTYTPENTVVVLQDGRQQPHESLMTHQLLESHVPLESSTVLT